MVINYLKKLFDFKNSFFDLPTEIFLLFHQMLKLYQLSSNIRIHESISVLSMQRLV